MEQENSKKEVWTVTFRWDDGNTTDFYVEVFDKKKDAVAYMLRSMAYEVENVDIDDYLFECGLTFTSLQDEVDRSIYKIFNIDKKNNPLKN